MNNDILPNLDEINLKIKVHLQVGHFDGYPRTGYRTTVCSDYYESVAYLRSLEEKSAMDAAWRENCPKEPVVCRMNALEASELQRIGDNENVVIEEFMKRSVEQPQLALCCRKKDVVATDMDWLCEEFAGQRLVIYVKTKFMADRIVEYVAAKGKAALFNDCEAAYLQYMKNKSLVVVTIAPFATTQPKDGVVHYGIPDSLAAYYHELGTGCRRAILFYNERDKNDTRRLLKRDGVEAAAAEWRVVEEYLASKMCRYQLLKAYFEEKSESGCGRCDNCAARPSLEQQLLSFKTTYKNLNIPRMLIALYNYTKQHGFDLPFNALEQKCIEKNEIINYVSPKKRKEVFLDLVQLLLLKGYAVVIYDGSVFNKKVVFGAAWEEDYESQSLAL